MSRIYNKTIVAVFTVILCLLSLDSRLAASQQRSHELVQVACDYITSNMQPGAALQSCGEYRYRNIRSVFAYGGMPDLWLVYIQFSGNDTQGPFRGVAACVVDSSAASPQVKQCEQKM